MKYLLPFISKLTSQDQASWEFLPDTLNIRNNSSKSRMQANNAGITDPDLIGIKLQQVDKDIKQLTCQLTILGQLEDEETENQVQAEIDILNNVKTELERQLQNIQDLKDSFRNNFDIPKLGEVDQKIEWNSMFQILPPKVDGLNPNEFANTWSTIKTIATTHKFSKRNLEEILKAVLIGECLAFFQSKAELAFEDKLLALLQMYVPQANIRTRLADLKNHRRTSNQTIYQFIFLIDQTEAVTSPDLRTGRKPFLMEQGLLQNCT